MTSVLLYVVCAEGWSGMVVELERAFWAVEPVLIASFLLVLIASAFGYSAIVRGQRRGYRPAGLTIGVLLIVLAATGVANVVVERAVDLSRPSPETDLLSDASVALDSGAAAVGAVGDRVVIGDGASVAAE